MSKESAPPFLIYGVAFMVGCVLMGFEMLGSRYLFPWFGGGIGTWAGLISMVLCALAIGYFAGGIIVDRQPSLYSMCIAIIGAAIWMVLVPASADPVMSWILAHIGDGPPAILLASAALLLLPLTLLGTLSPMAVRLLLRSTKETGRVSGLVYGISTMGNVFGTLFTTFFLIPAIGSRSITYLYAALLVVCAIGLFIGARRKA